jgi:signal transduction histidine kinase
MRASFDELLRATGFEASAGLSHIADDLAHQIRDPLNVIRLNLALAERRMRSDSLDVAAIRDLLARADEEVGWLARLVREFLDYARPAPLQLSRAELGASAAAVVALTWVHAERRGVEVTLERGAPVVLVYDEERLKEALHRVLQNAVEASRPGGRVEMRIRDDAQRVGIEIDLEGHALPEVGGRVFAPFYTTRPGRAGFGLAVVAKTVVAHGGTVGVHQRGGVTTFAITLPREGAS